MSIKGFFKSSLHFVCFENFHNKRANMKILHTCGLKLSILPSSKPRSTLNSFFIFATTSDSSLLPDSTQFVKQKPHTAPPKDRRGIAAVQIPDWRKLQILGNYSFTQPFASRRRSRSWSLEVFCSPEFKGLTLCPWNHWVSIWSVLPFGLVSCTSMWPYIFGSWVHSNWLRLPQTENWLHLTSPSRLK